MGYQLMISATTLLVAVLMLGCSNTGPNSASTSGTSGSPSQAIQRGDVVRAVLAGDFNRVENLRRRGADLNENVGDDENAVTPLMAAVLSRRGDITLLLLDHGASIHPTYMGYSAYGFALEVFGDQSPIVKNMRPQN